MKGVITGDIVNSSSTPTEHWLPNLKGVLRKFGSEKKDWQIYRGDSFQLITTVEDALYIAFCIKIEIKESEGLDVRMAIGLGKVDYLADNILQSNGEAFVNSGHLFDQLKKDLLKIKSTNALFDTRFNVVLDLVSFFANHWSVTEARTLNHIILQSNITQKELAQKLAKSQSTVSATLKRAGYEEIQKVLDLYHKEIKAL